MMRKSDTTIIFGVIMLLFAFPHMVAAQTVVGGGYSVQQTITPIQGNLTGGGFVLQEASQSLGGINSGNTYTVQGVFGVGTTSVTPTPTSTPPSPQAPVGNGGGYFVFQVVATSTNTKPTVPLDNRSTCSSRVTFSGPIDIGLKTNKVEDVKKLEQFLNTYENEKLPVNGIYEQRDLEAVKRWQVKYRTFILDPMKLRKPTGTVYILSQRQIERQTTAACGQAVVVTSCPFFKEYAVYGDRGDDVKKIQLFLNIVRGEKLPVSGVYGPLTREAAKRFQRASRAGFFDSISYGFISGNWNKQTRIKANKAMGCEIVE